MWKSVCSDAQIDRDQIRHDIRNMPEAKPFEQFASSTSMHGVGKVVLTKKPGKRFVWFIIFVFCWTMFIYHLSIVLTAYFKYPVKTTVKVVPSGVPFPAITLCNMDSWDYYALQRLISTTERFLVNGYDNNTKYRPLIDFADENDSFVTNIARFYDNIHSFKSDTEDLQYFKLLSRTTVAANMKEEVVKSSAVQQNEFIIKCKYGQKECNFTKIFSPYYFNCFTFTPPDKSSISDKNEMNKLLEGIENGFSVMVWTGGKNMLPDTNGTKYIKTPPGIYDRSNVLSGTSGIRIVIHPPGTTPFPLTEGYDVPPGKMASLGISLSHFRRKKAPYGQCSDSNPYDLDLEEFKKEPYREVRCERMCLHNYVIRECNCYETALPEIDNVYCYPNLSFCAYLGDNSKTKILRVLCNETGEACWNLRQFYKDLKYNKMFVKGIQKCRTVESFLKCYDYNNSSECIQNNTLSKILKNIECAEKAVKRMMSSQELMKTCQCHQECNKFGYDVSYSLSQWPLNGVVSKAVKAEIEDTKFVEGIADKQKRKLTKKHLFKHWETSKGEFSKINVYISDNNVVQTIESPEMTPTQLISEIGGQLGIWIGVSVITLSEVMELIFNLAKSGFRRLFGWKKVNGEDLVV